MPRTEEQVFIKVDGRALELADAKLIRVTLEQSLLLPDAFNIVLADGLEWLQDDTFGLGKEVKLELAQGTGSRKTLVTGEVTGLMPSMASSNEVELHIRGYDRSHRLMRGRHTRSFVQMTDSDIAQRVAQELGLGTDFKATTQVNDYVLQHNQTNLEFLQERAAAIGYQVGVTEGNLYFKPVGQPTGSDGAMALPIELTWGENLEDFDVSRTTPGQATEVVVRGWDPKAKAAVVGQSTSSEAGPSTKRQQAGGKTVKSAFSMEAPMTFMRGDVTSQAAAERLAQVISDELHGSFTTALGTTAGDPSLRAGADVKISGVGVFDGTYRVSSAQHCFDQRGYRTTFHIEGARRSSSGLHATPATPLHQQGMVFVSGIVTNNVDPQNLGRIKVKLPMLADDLESDWCRLVSPMGGNERGFFFLPEVDDEVLVAFYNGPKGEKGVPFILGTMWNGKDAPPLPTSAAVKDSKVVQRVIKTRAKNSILLDDTLDKERIVIEDKNGNQIVIESGGKNKRTAKLTIKSVGDISIEADNNITIKAGGAMNVQSSGNMTVKGATVNIN